MCDNKGTGMFGLFVGLVIVLAWTQKTIWITSQRYSSHNAPRKGNMFGCLLYYCGIHFYGQKHLDT